MKNSIPKSQQPITNSQSLPLRGFLVFLSNLKSRISNARKACAILCLIVVVTGCGQSPAPTASGKTTDHWLSDLNGADPKVRTKAIKKLGNIGSKDQAALDGIFDALNDSDAAVRKEAIFAVVRNRSSFSSAVPILARMGTDDPDPHVRKIAAESHQNLSR